MTNTLKVLTVISGLFLSHIAIADSLDSIITKCWENHSHIEMSDCVKNVSDSSLVALNKKEAEIRQWIKNLSEEPRYIAADNKEFELSVKSFESYRTNQCNLYAALAAGGNAAHDLRSACEAELNAKRTEELTAMQKRWQ